MLFQKRKEKISPPYEALAYIYDFIMRHVNYVRWADFVQYIFRRYGLEAHDVFDMACGTGSTAIELAHRDFVLSGIDRSEGMLTVAKRKAKEHGLKINFQKMDLTDLHDLPNYDAVLCLYDSINYLCFPDQISQLLEKVYIILRDRGIFIFDVCTETNSLRYFRNYTDQGKWKDFSYIRRSIYDEKTRIQINEFHILSKDDKFIELHKQRIYRLSEMYSLIENSPFELLGVFDGFTFKSGTENSDRVHFVLRKGQVL